MFLIVFDHANTCASMRLLVEIHNSHCLHLAHVSHVSLFTFVADGGRVQHWERRDEDLHPVELRDQQDEQSALRSLQVRPQHL